MHYILIVTALVFSGAAWSELPTVPTELTLGWTIPTERQDGSLLTITEIAGYELMGTCLDNPVQVEDAEQNTISFPLDTSLSCDWEIVTVDIVGIRSGPSNTVTVEFNAPGATVLRRVSF